jgi:hypothetical protein
MNTAVPMEPLVIGVLTTILGVLVGYLTGYAKKKGENRAMHEDIGKLTNQVAAVTKTAKEIEAKISSDVWDRQKRWELKREVLFEATQRAAQLDDALRVLNITIGLARAETSQEASLNFDLLRRQNTARADLLKATNAFDETKLWVSVVCGEAVTVAIQNLAIVSLKIAADLVNGEDLYDKQKPEFVERLLAARDAIREELRIDALEQPPPAESA